MPRLARVDVGDQIYHVINRANGRMQIFDSKEDYQIFEKLLLDTKELLDMRVLAYVLMPNHWHLLLYPKKDGDLGTFMHRLTNAHTRQVHVRTRTIGSGHLYQGRYKSFLVDTDSYFLALLKYIERNPARCRLSRRCESWLWGSAWRRIHGTANQRKLLSPSPVSLPKKYTKWINEPESPKELEEIRLSVNKGVPYGRDKWVDAMVTQFSLQSTTRNVGRPRNN